ncbi:MAG TPA: phosphoadenylyl-sulfate reductase [Chloroflexota bacterium]|nr:phosphoadenylyl-sulfate reductase [Chloroflexota bacterium]
MLEPRVWSEAALRAASDELEAASLENMLSWVDEHFSPGVTLASSFGGLSGMVLVDAVARLKLPFEIFYLDTDLLFPETYQTVERVKERYGLQPVAYSSQLSLADQARDHGSELWQRDPDLCCNLRKVEPNRAALRGKTAWVTGIRRDQTSNRRTLPLLEWDEGFGLVKLNPLAAWSEDATRAYIDAHNVPYNPLLDRGFRSIGCLPCTRAVQPGEDPRAGRWSGLEKTECGLHLRPSSLPVLAPSGGEQRQS